MAVAENGYETQVTPKVDVYSFGVLLLELLTGKQPLDPSFGEFEHIVPWVLATMKQNGPNLNDDVFDSTLLDTATDVQKEQMFQVLKIAIVCTKDIPSERLTMTHVLEILGMSRVIACSPLCN
jgi:serine/threonine protein kinase